MKRLIAALCVTAFLGGCLPFGLFTGNPDPYQRYAKSFGTYVTGDHVNAFCLTPKLRLVIWEIENYFGKKIVMSSGYRDPTHNGRVGGADDSYHMKCMAADFFIPGVDKRRLIAYAMRNRGVGGLGCYPGRPFIHIDVRERPRGWDKPVTFSGC